MFEEWKKLYFLYILLFLYNWLFVIQLYVLILSKKLKNNIHWSEIPCFKKLSPNQTIIIIIFLLRHWINIIRKRKSMIIRIQTKEIENSIKNKSDKNDKRDWDLTTADQTFLSNSNVWVWVNRNLNSNLYYKKNSNDLS